jgi:probable rRNA maturation factor
MSPRRPRPRRAAARRSARRSRGKPPAIEIVVDSALWKQWREVKGLLRRAIAAAASTVPAPAGELAVVLTDDAAIRALNRDWRRRDAATNVLSFPATIASPGGRANGRPGLSVSSRAPRLLGDIVIAYQTTAREARAERKPFGHHLSHLAVHGFLHLLGYDHMADADAQIMEGLETAILADLGVPDPYLAR